MGEWMQAFDKVIEYYCFGTVLIPFLYATVFEAVGMLWEVLCRLRPVYYLEMGIEKALIRWGF